MTKDTLETLSLEREAENLLVVRMNRPQAANAINTQMGRDLLAVFESLLLDSGKIRCAILTGVGNDFCAGGDLKERDGMSDDDWYRQHAIFERTFYTLLDCPIPVIAAVNGSAYGGGCELALMCDFIYAAKEADFGLTETTLGIIPGGGGTQTLARAVGKSRARELIYTGQRFSADDALLWGMVNRVVSSEALIGSVIETAERIALSAPIAVKRAKKAIGLGSEIDLKSGLALEIEAYNFCARSSDRREGISAFRAKRPPQFRGE